MSESLFLAVVGNQADLIDLILDAGADIDARNTRHKTPLMVAASYSHTESVKTLIRRGAKVNLKDENGNTALMHAVFSLMHAVFSGSPDLVLVLLQAGANPNIKNSYGESAMDAVQPGFEAEEIIALLENWGFEQKLCMGCGQWNPLTGVCRRLGPPNYRNAKDVCTEE